MEVQFQTLDGKIIRSCKSISQIPNTKDEVKIGEKVYTVIKRQFIFKMNDTIDKIILTVELE
ncbi:UNVERIFIED_CONTAM: hypothetical protein Cloal_3534 [Acetivibrio alkalicellulosi]